MAPVRAVAKNTRPALRGETVQTVRHESVPGEPYISDFDLESNSRGFTFKVGVANARTPAQAESLLREAMARMHSIIDDQPDRAGKDAKGLAVLAS